MAWTRSFLLLWLLIGGAGVVAQTRTVIVRAATASSSDYEAYIQAAAERVSPIQEYRRLHPSPDMRRLLVQRYAAAQQSFLSGSLEAARSSYEAVVQMLLQDDWGPAEREAFLISYLRLAQMAISDEERDAFLRASMTLGGNAQPPASLFPPPLLERRRQLARREERLRVSTVLLTDYEVLLINGVAHSLASKDSLELPPGRYRVTYLSSHKIPLTRLLAAEHIGRVPPSKDYVSGHCEQWEVGGPFPSAIPFFGPTCPRDSRSLQLKATNVSREGSHLDRTDALSGASEIPTPQPHQPLYKRPWLWTAAGAALTILVISQQRTPQSRERTASHGFN